ncbi:hypothetical protein [Mesorhizobium sp. A623]
MRNLTEIRTPNDETRKNDPDFLLAQDAVAAFWQAYEKNRLWWSLSSTKPIISCCILSALAVRDILHGVGRCDAEVFRSGLELLSDRPDGGWLMIGDPMTPVVDGLWPAHMTVKLGDYLIDPVIGQTKRPWNDMPRSMILQADRDPGVPLELGKGGAAKIYTWAFWNDGNADYRLSYFKLTHDIHKRTRDWKSSPDANPERREWIVRDAIALMQRSPLKIAA